LLAHNPDVIDEVASHGIALVLCGHTHGGQVSFPFVGPPIVPSKFGAKYASGLFRVGDTQMYVNKGIGLIRPAVRFLTRPEIVTIRLRRAVSGRKP
jgi:predicted MPP superfamily phosphohydrolase